VCVHACVYMCARTRRAHACMVVLLSVLRTGKYSADGERDCGVRDCGAQVSEHSRVCICRCVTLPVYLCVYYTREYAWLCLYVCVSVCLYVCVSVC
jgi:hypothetical protein